MTSVDRITRLRRTLQECVQEAEEGLQQVYERVVQLQSENSILKSHVKRLEQKVSGPPIERWEVHLTTCQPQGVLGADVWRDNDGELWEAQVYPDRAVLWERINLDGSFRSPCSDHTCSDGWNFTELRLAPPEVKSTAALQGITVGATYIFWRKAL